MHIGHVCECLHVFKSISSKIMYAASSHLSNLLRKFTYVFFYLRTTVPSGCLSHSSNAYMYGSELLPTLPNPCELIADAFGLPADLRRYSVGASSLINDARDSFGCNDKRALKLEHPLKLSPARAIKIKRKQKQ